MFKWIASLALIFLCLPLVAIGANIHVPGDQATIQAGIDAAVNGDTVIVADGIWTGDGNRDLDFLGKNIVVRSANGPENCTIDCQGSKADPHRGFHLQSGEGRDAEIQGLTITNGHADMGGAIRFQGAQVTIRGNIIIGNYGANGGGIVRSQNISYRSKAYSKVWFWVNGATNERSGSSADGWKTRKGMGDVS